MVDAEEPVSSILTAAKNEESSNPATRRPNILSCVSNWVFPVLTDGFIAKKPGQPLESPSQEKVRPELLARSLSLRRPLSDDVQTGIQGA